MSILDALKNLVAKRGGTPKGSNIAEVIDDLAETSSGGGGGDVVVVDIGELPVEHGVDAVDASTGEVETLGDVYLFDVDPNKYYIFKNGVEMDPGVYANMYDLQATLVTGQIGACEDTSDEPWVEGKTFSDTVNITMIDAVGIVEPVQFIFAPTSTQFKTYKKYSGEQQ